jgi:hypothetical protein
MNMVNKENMMKIVTLTDEQYEQLLKNTNEEGQKLVEDNTIDSQSVTRFSVNSSSEMAGLYEDMDDGKWVFIHDLIGYEKADLYKATHKYHTCLIAAQSQDEAVEKARTLLRVQKNGMHRLRVTLQERNVNVDGGNYIDDAVAYRTQYEY